VHGAGQYFLQVLLGDLLVAQLESFLRDDLLLDYLLLFILDGRTRLD